MRSKVLRYCATKSQEAVRLFSFISRYSRFKAKGLLAGLMLLMLVCIARVPGNPTCDNNLR